MSTFTEEEALASWQNVRVGDWVKVDSGFGEYGGVVISRTATTHRQHQDGVDPDARDYDNGEYLVVEHRPAPRVVSVDFRDVVKNGVPSDHGDHIQQVAKLLHSYSNNPDFILGVLRTLERSVETWKKSDAVVPDALVSPVDKIKPCWNNVRVGDWVHMHLLDARATSSNYRGVITALEGRKHRQAVEYSGTGDAEESGWCANDNFEVIEILRRGAVPQPERKTPVPVDPFAIPE